MDEISRPVKKKDHDSKLSGRAIYVADHPNRGVLFGKILRSTTARAKIRNVKIPNLPEDCFIVDKNDVPGENRVKLVRDDTPVFAEDRVEYIGEAILMAVGPDEESVKRILKEIEVEYEELPPVLSVQDSDTVFFEYSFAKGNVDKAMEEADHVLEEVFETGYQAQAYLETQGMMAQPTEDGKILIRGSLQCPYYVHGAVSGVMGTGPDRIRVVQDATGGGFGGKEDYPSILGAQVAVAAKRAGAPVRVIFDRREDMECTGKRHPSRCTYRVAVKNGRVTAIDADVVYNAGAYTTLSPVVLQRGIIAAQGVYRVDNLRVRGRAVKTNTVPCGAFRGFGAPQVFFAVEMMMNHVARVLGRDELDFKLEHLARQGDITSTGGKYHFPVPLPEMVLKVDAACSYRRKRAEYAKAQTGRYRRGIGISMVFHGAGFTGAGERDIIKAVVRLRKHSDGRVEILAANADIGQGVKTTFCKIVAFELDLPPERVFFENPDTDRVPDSGPTVASRSIMTVGEMLRRAAARLRENWRDGIEEEVEERFSEPDFVIPFSLDSFYGDAYPAYAWGVTAFELEVDTLTGVAVVLGAWGGFDVGTPIDMNIVVGQMEGGVLQGLGYSSMERMTADDRGRIRNNSFADYIIPTSMDAPNISVIMHSEKYPLGPYGAKGAGELPLVGVPAAYAHAMEQALGETVNHVPFTIEDTMNILREASK